MKVMSSKLIVSGILFLVPFFSVGDLRGEEISIAFWNVENLFDGYLDRRTPREDLFVPSTLREKLRKDGEILRELNADIVGLMEVENRGILKQLIDEELADLGYRYFALLDEGDERGIDVALISRRPFLCYSYDVPTFYRGILTARFAVDGKPFYVIVNHWKSRFGGGEEQRLRCAQRVIEIVNELIPNFEGNVDVPIIVGGDLNDNDTDVSVVHLEQHGLINTLKDQPLQQRWTLPYFNQNQQQVELDSFDHLLVNPYCHSRGKLRWLSSSVVRPERMLSKRSFLGKDYVWPDDDHDDHIGYSDHFPVLGRFQIQAEK